MSTEEVNASKLKQEEGQAKEGKESTSAPDVEPVLSKPDAVKDVAKGNGELVVSVKMLYQTAVVAALACSILSVFMYDRFFATKIAVFDYPDFLIRVRNGVISGAISQDQLKNYMELAESKIKSQPRNYVVLSGDVLLGDGKGAKKISDGIDIPRGPVQGSGPQTPGVGQPLAGQGGQLTVPGIQQQGGVVPQMPPAQGGQ